MTATHRYEFRIPLDLAFVAALLGPTFNIDFELDFYKIFVNFAVVNNGVQCIISSPHDIPTIVLNGNSVMSKTVLDRRVRRLIERILDEALTRAHAEILLS